MAARWTIAAAAALLTGCFETAATVDGGDATSGSTSSASAGPNTTSTTSEPSSTSDPGTTGTTTDGDTTEDSTGTTGDSATSGSSTGSVPVSVCPEFTDDFEDGVEDSRWIQPYPLSTQEIDGVSRFTVTPALNDEFVRMMVAPESGMAGTTVTVELGETSDAVGMESTLWIQWEGTERLSFRRYARNNDVLLEVFVRDGTGMTSVVHDEAFDDVEHQFLRVVGDATTLSFEVSSDGVAFTQVHTAPTPFGADPVQVGFVGNNRSALLGEEIVSFEGLSITCPEP